jgi:PAS domain S-box-containing protein
MLIQIGQLTVALVTSALALFVLRGSPTSNVNRAFAAQCLLIAGWTLGLSGLHSADTVHESFALAFALASLIPAGILIFIYSYSFSFPGPAILALPTYLKSIVLIGLLFAGLSLSSDLIFYDATLTTSGVTRKTGALYPAFAIYFVSSLCVAFWVFIRKWRATRGPARARYRHLGAGLIASLTGGITTNLLIPLWTGQSTYSWLGPYFTLVYVGFVAHAIIRHRFMDLRLFIHRGLTLGFAGVLSFIPVGILLMLFWPRLLTSLQPPELALLLTLVGLVTVLIPITRDVAGRLLDRYVYRTHANYQRTVREASQMLTRVLHLDKLLAFITTTVVGSTGAEGVAVYLREGASFRCATTDRHQDSGHFDAPPSASVKLIAALDAAREPILTEEFARGREECAIALHADLACNGWALLLPVLSEDTLIAIIAVGPKISGDSFYQQDLDLLMTLANQAGIAIKNAQLYAAVVVANEYLENIVAALESGVVAIDANGQIAIFNRAAEVLTGLTAATLRAKDATALPPCLSDPLHAAVRDGEPTVQPEVELVTVTPGGDATMARPVICTTSPVRDPSGLVLGAVAVFSDLTPLKELETQRRNAERLIHFQTLAAGIAHELKNPLVAIKTFTQLLPRRRQDPRFLDEFGRIAVREIDRMQRIIDRLSALSGPTNGARDPLDVRAPLEDAVEFLAPTFEEKNISLSAALPTEACVITGNAGEVEQLFLNLLLNAYDATPSGGTVRVTAFRTETEIVVTFSDDGPGIAPELLEKIFEPFFTTKARGSGLGLAISASIAQAHGGRVRASNGDSGGSMFSVEFPITTPASAPTT